MAKTAEAPKVAKAEMVIVNPNECKISFGSIEIEPNGSYVLSDDDMANEDIIQSINHGLSNKFIRKG